MTLQPATAGWLQASGHAPTKAEQASLQAHGAWLHSRHREPWSEPLRHDPRDATTQRAFALWLGGDILGARDLWEELFLSGATRVVGAFLLGRGAPREVVRQALPTFREGFFYRMAGYDGAQSSVPGWQEVALRVLEAHGPPLEQLLGLLDGRGQRLAAWCVASRGHMRGSLSRMFSEGDRATRSQRLATIFAEDPTQIEALFEAHVVLRWFAHTEHEAIDLALARRVADANAGRARARLRAILLREPQRWLEGVLQVPALFNRTRQALARYVRDLASREFPGELNFSSGTVEAPCTLEQPGALEAFGPEETRMARAWVLATVLRDPRFPGFLGTWARDGGLGFKLASWNRRLAELPEALTDGASGPGRQTSRLRLRNHLVDALPRHLAACEPIVEAATKLDERSASCKRELLELIEPLSHPAVPPPPSRQTRHILRSAPETLANLRALLQPTGIPEGAHDGLL